MAPNLVSTKVEYLQTLANHHIVLVQGSQSRRPRLYSRHQPNYCPQPQIRNARFVRRRPFSSHGEVTASIKKNFSRRIEKLRGSIETLAGPRLERSGPPARRRAARRDRKSHRMAPHGNGLVSGGNEKAVPAPQRHGLKCNAADGAEQGQACGRSFTGSALALRRFNPLSAELSQNRDGHELSRRRSYRRSW
jgi:hypothetical protein